MKKNKYLLVAAVLSVATMLSSCGGVKTDSKTEKTAATSEAPSSERTEKEEICETTVATEQTETVENNTVTEAAATETPVVEEQAKDVSTEISVTEAPAVEEQAEDAITETTETPTETTVSESETASTEAVPEETVSETDEEHPEPAPVVDEKLQGLLDEIRASLPTSNGDWAVYVCDLKNDSDDYCYSHQMQAASLIKLYIMGAVYEDYDAIIEIYGKDSIDSNLYYMITVSDNDCANRLTEYLGRGDTTVGMQVVNEFCQRHAFPDTHMGRLLLHSNEYDDNYTSVNDCGRLLRAIRLRNIEEFPHADDMFNLLCQQERRNKIPAELDVPVANKTGELDDVENDAGIIYNVENELVIVFMSEHLQDVYPAWGTISSLSKMIYNYYN